MDDSQIWIYILLTLSACAFFSGIEIAFISANKLRIELKNKQGQLSARILSDFVKSPSKFISTCLVGNNIGLVLYGLLMGIFLEPYLQKYLLQYYPSQVLALLVETIIATLIVLFTAEFLPKALFRLNADTILPILVFPFLPFYWILYPIVVFVVWLSKKSISLVTGEAFEEDTPVFSRLDLDHYIAEGANLDLDDDADVDTEIFRNALDFASVKVRDCMVPRTEIIAVEISESVEELFKAFTSFNHSKVLVYRDNIDNIIGYVHQVELFKKPKSLQSVLIPIIIATETTPANDLMKQFTQQRKSIAVVVDEVGGTSGIVTIEDIIEEIFGEIEDEYDVQEHTEKKISDDEYLFSARLEMEYLNEKYDLDLPEGDYETLGGLIFAIHQDIPKEGDIIHVGEWKFTVLAMEGTRIKELKLLRQPAQ